MPIYEYKCPECGEVFEEWAKSCDSHKDCACPKCETLSPRIISRTSFVLKGDGWYVSDYGYRKGIKEDSGAGAPVPAAAKPVTPAKQGEKSLAKASDGKKEKPKAEKAAAPAPKTETKTTPVKADKK